jgi:hypothetical protein
VLRSSSFGYAYPKVSYWPHQRLALCMCLLSMSSAHGPSLIVGFGYAYPNSSYWFYSLRSGGLIRPALIVAVPLLGTRTQRSPIGLISVSLSACVCSYGAARMDSLVMGFGYAYPNIHRCLCQLPFLPFRRFDPACSDWWPSAPVLVLSPMLVGRTGIEKHVERTNTF